jgi:hypothetical protein
MFEGSLRHQSSGPCSSSNTQHNSTCSGMAWSGSGCSESSLLHRAHIGGQGCLALISSSALLHCTIPSSSLPSGPPFAPCSHTLPAALHPPAARRPPRAKVIPQVLFRMCRRRRPRLWCCEPPAGQAAGVDSPGRTVEVAWCDHGGTWGGGGCRCGQPGWRVYWLLRGSTGTRLVLLEMAPVGQGSGSGVAMQGQQVHVLQQGMCSACMRVCFTVYSTSVR